MTTAPWAADPRPDLDWLRHRSRRPPPGPGPAGGSPSGLADFLAGRTSRTGSARPRPGPAPGDADLSAPADDLDLSTPPVQNDRPLPGPPPAAPLGDLDLSTPPSAPPVRQGDLDLGPPAQPVGDLDLSGAPAPPVLTSGNPPSPGGTPPGAPSPGPTATRPSRRVAPGARVILTRREPTVTLNRVQSGVGALTLTAVCSPAVGDLVLGAVYELADGTAGLLDRAGGITAAPPRSRRPVLEGSRGEFDRISIDLRQARTVRRLVVYASSQSERELTWGGTLLVETSGGARVEVPLDLGRHAGPVVLLSLYAIDGEFVLRAELEPVVGLVRDVALAHGFGTITWADARTPVL